MNPEPTELNELQEEVKQIKTEIKTRTSKLQEELRKKQAKIRVLKLKIKKQNRIDVQDKSKHIIDRFRIWIDADGKETSEWIIDNGPMRDYVFNNVNRYETIDYVEDSLLDWFYGELGCRLSDQEAELQFSNLKTEKQEEITDIMEDAIEQNIKSFKCDW